MQSKAFNVVLAKLGRRKTFTFGPRFAVAVPLRAFRATVSPRVSKITRHYRFLVKSDVAILMFSALIFMLSGVCFILFTTRTCSPRPMTRAVAAIHISNQFSFLSLRVVTSLCSKIRHNSLQVARPLDIRAVRKLTCDRLSRVKHERTLHCSAWAKLDTRSTRSGKKKKSRQIPSCGPARLIQKTPGI